MRKGAHAAVTTQATAESTVGRMFDRIAPTYDLLNHLLSFGRDYAWRRRVAEQLDRKDPLKIIDLATGTGDLLIALLCRRTDIVEAAGLDVSEAMLSICARKLRQRRLNPPVQLVHADASVTPFADGCFDAVTMGFGIRNAADTPAVLQEIHRILRPGGMALILEFSLPKDRAVRWCYLRYLRFAVPLVGRLVSGDGQAYRYLDHSIEEYHQPECFTSFMRQAGFRDIAVTSLTFGVASIYRGVKGTKLG